MDSSIDNFTVCSDNWEKISEIKDIRSHLESVHLWYEADSEPNVHVLSTLADCLIALDNLYRLLIDLQVKLVSDL